ncbi:hypothetical protein [Pimelobacter simplex]|uniref:hypothetical protein n=1 Tax=Nocardioides simplex TaxID=2045 RepID=UPI003AAF33DC
MSYIKFEHRHLGEDLWLELSPAAFAVHTWALDHCNEQATDGVIIKHRALRLQCPVPPADLPAVWAELVDAGVWVEQEDGYRCPEFLAHGISAAEQKATRQKWALDKQRQRLHKIGNHQLCTPRSCPAAQAAADGVSTGWGQSTGGQVDSGPPVHTKTSGRSDQTRPDQNPKGSGSGRGPGPGSADAPPAEPGVWLDLRATPDDTDPHHVDIDVTLRGDASQYASQYATLLQLATTSLGDGIRKAAERHRCSDDHPGCLIDGDLDNTNLADRTLHVRVPEALATSWLTRVTTALQPAIYEKPAA